MQREAGHTRAGYHGRQAGGAWAGRWEDAHAFVAGSFAQHASRDGDPQLHNLVLNRARRETDGQCRTLDSLLGSAAARRLLDHGRQAYAAARRVERPELVSGLGVTRDRGEAR